jgi:hypothetical protein
MTTGELSAPAGTVKVGLLNPPTALITQPPEPHGVTQPVASVQISPGVLQTTGVPPQTPAPHTSLVVQVFPSLHDVPSATLMMAGHLGGPPPWRQLCDSRTWQDDVGCAHTCLWQVSGPDGAAVEV